MKMKNKEKFVIFLLEALVNVLFFIINLFFIVITSKYILKDLEITISSIQFSFLLYFVISFLVEKISVFINEIRTLNFKGGG